MESTFFGPLFILLGCGALAWVGSLLYVLIPRPALKQVEASLPR